MNGTWHDCIVVDELPELYCTIAEAIGRELMIELAVKCQKMHLYLKRLPADADESKLSEDYRLAGAVIGLENVRLLAEAMPSEMFYLVGENVVFMPAKRRWVEREFNGANHRRLALATSLSQFYIYQILKKSSWQQLGLFKD